MSNKDQQIVEKIIKHITTTLEYCREKSFEEFNTNSMLHEACVFNLLQIGELSNHLTDAFQNEHPDIPWRLMVGLRNRLVHDYDGIRLMIVWQTITSDFEPLKKQLINSIS